MTSGYERPDRKSLEELGQLLQHVGEELAAWRRRSLRAEAELQEVRSRGGAPAGPELLQARQRLVELESENQALHQRMDSAWERVRTLANRLSFLEQDVEDGAA